VSEVVGAIHQWLTVIRERHRHQPSSGQAAVDVAEDEPIRERNTAGVVVSTTGW
jgi:hypothetical protein